MICGLIITATVGHSQTEWSLTGNFGISPPTQFLGTTDASPIPFYTDNDERGLLEADGTFWMYGTNGAVPTSGAGTRLMWVLICQPPFV